MESWKNTKNENDAYIQWIEYSRLIDVQAMTSLHHECTHIADWSEPTTNKLMKVIFKTIVDGRNGQSFDFYQVNYFYFDQHNNIVITHVSSVFKTMIVVTIVLWISPIVDQRLSGDINSR